MKTSKLLITSLLAAAAMGASAFAEIDSEYGTLEWTTAPSRGGDYYSGDYALSFNFTEELIKTLDADKSYVVAAYWGADSDNPDANAVVLNYTKANDAWTLQIGRGELSPSSSYSGTIDGDTTFTFFSSSDTNYVTFTQTITAGTTYTLSVTGGDQAMTPTLSWGTDNSETLSSYKGNMNGGGQGGTVALSSALLTLYYLKDCVWGGGATGNWTDASWTIGESTNQTLGNLSNVTFNSSADMTATDAVTLNAITVADGSTLTLSGSGTVSSGSLATTGSVSISGGAKLAITSQNTTLDFSNVSGSGTLAVAAVGNTSDSGGNDPSFSTITIGNSFSGTVEITSGIVDMLTGDMSSAISSVRLGSASKVVLNGGGLLFRNVDNTTQSDKGSFTTAIEVGAAGGVIRVYGNGNVTIASDISGAGTLKHTDGGTLTLAGTVNMTGGFSQVAGTTNFNGANVTLGAVNQTDGTLNFTGANATIARYKGPTSADGGTNPVTNVGADTTLNVTGEFYLRFQGNGTSTLNVDGDMVVGGALNLSRDGNGIVNVRDGGTLVAASIGFGQNWDGTSTKSSVVNLASGGTLVAGAMTKLFNNINSSSLNLNGGVLGTTAESLTISVDSLPIVLGTGTTSTINTGKYDTASKTFTDVGAAISIANVISGDGALKKAGAGTLTLSNANTYKGGTVIEAGTVVAAHANALGTTKGVEVQSGATLNLGASAVTVAGLSGAGTVGLADGTTSSTLTVDSATDSTFSGSIGNAVSLVKQGTGTLELSGANFLYSMTDNAYQAVSVDGGTLRIVTNRQAVTYAGATTVASGAALEVSVSDGVSVSLDSVSISEGGKLIIDLSDYASATETFALDLITTSALQYNGEGFASDCTSLLGNAVELKGWTQTGWAESLAYDGTTLSLTMTIPEPSAFGLLAGAGALALVAARRRRTK
ncbi:MAG: beta strand repeat-containing protein, partial [Candidatus Spyradosoma sp.]